MKKVFICSPYSGDIIGNTDRALMYCRDQVAAGNIPFAPHLYFPQFMAEANPLERERGISMGIEIMRFMDELHVYGYNITNGMGREIMAWYNLERQRQENGEEKRTIVLHALDGAKVANFF